MADDTKFFEEQKPEEQEVQAELEKIKIGETEYEPKELETIIEKGKKAAEFSKKYDTDLDKVYPEFTRKSQENKALKEELEQLRQQVQTRQAAQATDLTEEQLQQAREQARKIGIMTQGDMDNWYQSRRAAEKLLEDCGGFETEIDGSDGRPKFSTEEILTHMSETGIKNPLKAYKDKYEVELEAWKASELNKEKGVTMPTMTTMGAPGTKQPKNVPVTKDNIGQMIREQLWGSEKNE